MLSFILRLVLIGLIASEFAGRTIAGDVAAPDTSLKILFLGDRGHHQPFARFRQLQPALAARSIEITYTEDLSVLDHVALAKYDGLLLYANIDKIEESQAKALLNFVAGGKGFIPLHCASYCFRNNDDVVALIGAQFQRHGTGVIRIAPDAGVASHPVVKNYRGFESWDETYVHTKHNYTNRTVLEYRTDEKGREPWTWVRTHGKGRVFYTAWGHDERTWSNPGFQNLVERGIRWACGGDEAVAAVPAFADRPEMTSLPTDAKPFEYADAKIAFYPPGGARKGDGEWNKMQLPVSPAESMKHIVTPVGFQVELFVAEPQLGGKPLAMNWDERGRLWVCESYDYPNELQEPGRGRDRIRICEDTDGDGRADKFTVFAEKLSIPTTLTFYRGGAIVQDGKETVYLKDTDGDDRADIRKVLITGWGLGDTHGGVSNFQYGLDNWYYGMQGYNNSTPTFDGGRQTSQAFRMGFFRFRLAGENEAAEVKEVEFLRSTNNNTWGLGISEEGLIFGSTANGNPSEFMPIANRYYEAVRGWSPEVLRGIAESNKFEPITERVRQVDQHGGFTAAAGHAIYTARKYPPEYWNRTAFVTEPTGHLVATFVLRPDGAGFRSRNSWNLFASNDEWTAPIMAEVGPDGNVWIIDWYNYIVQHNPTPAGFTTGKGNAYETELRDKKHGRVYRIVWTASGAEDPRVARSTPSPATPSIKSDNLFWRRHSQRLMVEAGLKTDDVLQSLVLSAKDSTVDAAGLNTAAMHALATLHGLGVVNDENTSVMSAVVAGLKHKSAGVRRVAVTVLPRTDKGTAALLYSGCLNDSESQVRLAALLALAEMPASRHAAAALSSVATEQNLDSWTSDAVTAAAARHDIHFLQLAGTSQTPQPWPAAALQSAAIVAEHYARGAPTDSIATIIKASATATLSLQEAILTGLAKGWPKDKPVSLDDASETTLVNLVTKASPGARASAVTLALKLGSKKLESQVGEIAAGFLAVARDEKAKDEDRIAAARQLIEFRRMDAGAVADVLSLISPRTSPELATGLIEAVGQSESPQAANHVLNNFTSFTPAVRPAALRVLLNRTDWIRATLDALEKGSLPLNDLSLDQKQALANHPDKTLAKRAKDLLAKGGGLPNPDRQKVLDELLPLTKLTADAKAGKEVFKKQCLKCHTHSGEGSKIGPDLTGMAVHPKHELLIHLIDPSRSVEGNFRVYTVVTADGRVLNGLLSSESKTAIELIDAEAKRHAIQRADIEQMVASTKSLMPEGFEKQVTRDDIKNLLEFLTQRGKFLPLPLDKLATAVSTKGMFFAPESNVERLIFSDWSPKTFEGVPFILTDPQGDRRPNVILLYGPNGTLPPKMPKSVSLTCNTPAKAIHLLSGVGGWSFPASAKGTVSMIVRLRYADGQAEDHPLLNGEHFADYIRRVDVDGSKFAFALRGQQIRYLAIHPARPEEIELIELLKGPDSTAPIVMALTVETR